MNKKWIVISSLTLVIMMSACARNAPAPTSSVNPPTGAPAASTGPAGNTPAVSPGGAANTPAVTAPPTAPGAATGPAATPGAVNAQTVYKQNCISCHGVNLGGGAGPNLQKVGSRLSADQIASTIANGRGGMPPFKGTLKDNEIHALADWLAANK